MSRAAKQEARKVGRPELAMPEPIDDTPENVTNAVLSTPPKRRSEWRFIQKRNSGAKLPARFEASGEGN